MSNKKEGAKQNLKSLLMSLVFLTLILFSLNALSAATCAITASNNCPLPNHAIMRLSASDNAHGELMSQNNYNNVLCCDFGTGGLTCNQASPTLPSNEILSLFALTNAHAEAAEGTTYANKVCYDSLTSCWGAPDFATPAVDEIEVISLSSSTNAHLGTSYQGDVRVFCTVVTPPTGPVCGDGIPESPETCDDGNTVSGDGCSATCQIEEVLDAYWSDAFGNEIPDITIRLDESIFLKGRGLYLYDGQVLSLEIYEDDSFKTKLSDNSITTKTSSVSNGNVDISWAVSDADLQNTGEYTDPTDYSFDDFYFRIRDSNDNLVATSDYLTMTLSTEVPCTFIDTCSDYTNAVDCGNDNEQYCGAGAANYVDSEEVDCSASDTNCGCWWDNDAASGQECQPRVNYTYGPSFCGDNGVQVPNDAGLGEQCDPDEGTPVFDAIAGDACTDLDSYTGGNLGCYTGGDLACQFDTTGCTGGTPSCGDNLINQIIEDCDGTALRGWDCTDFGFASGNLACNAGGANSCTFNTAGCVPFVTGGVCGDDIQQAPNSNGFNEQCDDGNTASGDGCSATCTSEGTTYCGDGIVQKPNDNGETEECEDGNTNDGDGCSSLCQNEGNGGICGDDTQQAPNSNGFNEQCDDGNLISSDGCSATCTSEGTTYCGDNIIQVPNNNGQNEECEDGNTESGDLCSSMCQIESPTRCGDATIQNPNTGGMFEQCDGTNLGATNTCGLASEGFYTGGTLTCKSYCVYDYSTCTGNTPACLNGIIDNPLTEECDSPDFGIRGSSCDVLGFESGTVGCTNNCKVDTSQCNKPLSKSGSCQVTQETADDCSDGFLSFRWFGEWIGDIIQPKTSQCTEGGSDTIPCPAQIQLPFFSAYNVIAIIILAGLIYLIISKRKRPSVAALKKAGSRKKR